MNESSQEKEETRKSQRLRDKATAAAAEAKYSSDISVENIPSVRPRKSVKSSSRTENLPSGLVKSKVRRTPVPQSKQIKSHPSSEGREYIVIPAAKQEVIPAAKQEVIPAAKQEVIPAAKEENTSEVTPAAKQEVTPAVK